MKLHFPHVWKRIFRNLGLLLIFKGINLSQISRLEETIILQRFKLCNLHQAHNYYLKYAGVK